MWPVSLLAAVGPALRTPVMGDMTRIAPCDRFPDCSGGGRAVRFPVWATPTC